MATRTTSTRGALPSLKGALDWIQHVLRGRFHYLNCTKHDVGITAKCNTCGATCATVVSPQRQVKE